MSSVDVDEGSHGSRRLTASLVALDTLPRLVLAIASQHLITTFQAIVLGVLQGATELFPVSSLGHTVLFPTLFGWHNIVAWQSEPESPWLAFVVMLHVGSAVGLLIYFWRDWVAIVKGVLRDARASAGSRRRPSAWRG